jgi:vacuolar-type H+-ATPase subunit H
VERDSITTTTVEKDEAADKLLHFAAEAAGVLLSNADIAAEALRSKVYKSVEFFCRVANEFAESMRCEADAAAYKIRSEAKVAADELLLKADVNAVALRDNVAEVTVEARRVLMSSTYIEPVRPSSKPISHVLCKHY